MPAATSATVKEVAAAGKVQRCHGGTVRDATVACLEMVQSLNNYRENFGRLRTSGKFAGGCHICEILATKAEGPVHIGVQICTPRALAANPATVAGLGRRITASR